MPKVVIYTTATCPFCINAKRLLQSKGVRFDERRVDAKPDLRQRMMRESGQRTVPQIWIGQQHLGGYSELRALDKSGQLDPMLASPDQRTINFCTR